jgi:Fe-S-cluster containining protein
MGESFIFLTVEEAIEAIIIDFRQYDPQVMLFCSIISLISKNDFHFKREPGKKGVWINQGGRVNMRWLEGADLVDFMCAAIRDTRWTTDLLAAVCSRVFQGRAQPVLNPETGLESLQIETHMASFACRQCGRCCRSLDYHNDVTDADVARWKALARDDILRWVDPVSRQNETIGYRIWVVPGTHQLAGACPFLKKDSAANRWVCDIHAVKPQICRNYPVSRKHAAMTGCPGFNKPEEKNG